jgi:hypothetical protein
MPKLIARDLTLEQFEELKVRNAPKRTKKMWPEAEASWLSQMFYSYLFPLLSLGALNDRTLSADDLFDLPNDEKSTGLSLAFRKHYSTSNRSSDEDDDASLWRLIWGLWYLVRPIMIPAGQCNLVACGVQVAMPLLIRELVLAVADPDPEVAQRRGLQGAAWVAAGALIQAVAQQRQQHLANRAGMRMRACLIAEIFDTATRLSPKGEQGTCLSHLI